MNSAAAYCTTEWLYNTDEGQRSQLAGSHVETSPQGFPAKFGSCRAHPAQDKAGLSQLSSAGAATPWTFCQPIPVVFLFMVGFLGFNFPFLAKVGGAVNKFSKSQIRKFSDLNNLLNLWTFRKSGALRIFDFGIFFLCFAELKLLQVRKYIFFLLTNVEYNSLI
jgi:hypothetical protein